MINRHTTTCQFYPWCMIWLVNHRKNSYITVCNCLAWIFRHNMLIESTNAWKYTSKLFDHRLENWGSTLINIFWTRKVHCKNNPLSNTKDTYWVYYIQYVISFGWVKWNQGVQVWNCSITKWKQQNINIVKTLSLSTICVFSSDSKECSIYNVV